MFNISMEFFPSWQVSILNDFCQKKKLFTISNQHLIRNTKQEYTGTPSLCNGNTRILPSRPIARVKRPHILRPSLTLRLSPRRIHIHSGTLKTETSRCYAICPRSQHLPFVDQEYRHRHVSGNKLTLLCIICILCVTLYNSITIANRQRGRINSQKEHAVVLKCINRC